MKERMKSVRFKPTHREHSNPRRKTNSVNLATNKFVSAQYLIQNMLLLASTYCAANKRLLIFING